MIQNNEEKEMTFEHVVIIDDRYGCNEQKFKPLVYDAATVGDAIRDFRRRCSNARGICLAYTGAAWHFIGYVQDLIV